MRHLSMHSDLPVRMHTVESGILTAENAEVAELELKVEIGSSRSTASGTCSTPA